MCCFVILLLSNEMQMSVRRFSAIPHLRARWASAVKQVLLVQPSSPTAERVFSILRAYFNEQQNCVLVDYLQASVMSQYNKQ